MSYSESCCNTKPPVTTANYQYLGKKENFNEFQVYRLGSAESKFTLIAVYDICGFQPNTLQFLDKIATQADIQLLVPDFFRAGAWPVEDFPIADKAKFQSWLQTAGSYSVVSKDLKNVIESYKLAENGKKVGIIGFCWGGSIVVKALSDSDLPFVAGAMCHPAFLVEEDFIKIQKPVLALPSKDEPDMLPFFEGLKPDVKEKSEHVRFDEMKHGWCGCRGDLNDEKVKENYLKANNLVVQFFKKFI